MGRKRAKVMRCKAPKYGGSYEPHLHIPSHEFDRVFAGDGDLIDRLMFLLNGGNRDRIETFLFTQGCTDYVLDAS